MFGSHLSIAGTLTNALDEGEKLGLDCVQIFTKNQQQWKCPPLDPGVVRAWRERVGQLGWDKGGPDGRGGNTSHASYLINLGSVNPDLWRKSVDLMIEEVSRCETLGIPYLVHHPGSFVGADLATGLQRIEDAYAEIFGATRGFATVMCLESTVGAGSTIGGTFEHLRELRERIGKRTGGAGRVGFCVDTCHLHAAGYDISTRELATGVIRAFDSTCGLENLKVLHVNDSKGKAASRLDRHAHIGQGWIGGTVRDHAAEGVYTPARLRASGFSAFMGESRLANVPKILETPKGEDAKGKSLDAMNLRRLRMLRPGEGGGRRVLEAVRRSAANRESRR